MAMLNIIVIVPPRITPKISDMLAIIVNLRRQNAAIWMGTNFASTAEHAKITRESK
jgi:hypothetical protein